MEQKWKEDFHAQVFFSRRKTNFCGVLTAYFGTKKFTIKKQQKDHEDRIFILDVCSINDSKYILINLHNASTEKEQTEALSNLFALLTTIDIINLNKHLIMAVDFNLFLTRYLMQQVDTLH